MGLRWLCRLAPVMFVAACFQPDLPGAIGCADGGSCPGSLVCSERFVCEDPSQLTDGSVPTVDAGGDTSDGGAQPDADSDSELAWRRVQLSRGPSPRFGHAMTTDVSGEGVFMFGGTIPVAEEFVGPTWRFDGEAWIELAADVAEDQAPVSRVQHALAHHVTEDVVVLFGGFVELEDPLDDIWLWDGSAWAIPGLGAVTPPGRNGHAMAFAGSEVVMFGGFDGEPFADTWAWNGQRWDEADVDPAPLARAGHAMAYDASRRRVVLFGGSGGGSDIFGDTWEWDGEAWDLVPAEAPLPPARRFHAMAYDAERGEVLLFGGEATGSGQLLDDVWAWDGSAWREVIPGGGSPGPRRQHAMAYDPHLGRVVLFGGHDGLVPRADTWVLEASR